MALEGNSRYNLDWLYIDLFPRTTMCFFLTENYTTPTCSWIVPMTFEIWHPIDFFFNIPINLFFQFIITKNDVKIFHFLLSRQSDLCFAVSNEFSLRVIFRKLLCSVFYQHFHRPFRCLLFCCLIIIIKRFSKQNGTWIDKKNSHYENYGNDIFHGDQELFFSLSFWIKVCINFKLT